MRLGAWLLLNIALVLVDAAVVDRCQAAPPEHSDPALAPFFQSLTVPETGGSCCGQGDCRGTSVWPVRGPDADGAYSVLYNGTWLPVPKTAISDRQDNPTGDYISCLSSLAYVNGKDADRKVICFILAPRT